MIVDFADKEAEKIWRGQRSRKLPQEIQQRALNKLAMLNRSQNMKKSDLHFPHPGEILKSEFLDELGITQYRLAVDTKIPHSRVTAIIKGRRAVTADTALRLARYFGNSPQFWLGLQQDYDLRSLQETALLVEEEVAPYGKRH